MAKTDVLHGVCVRFFLSTPLSQREGLQSAYKSISPSHARFLTAQDGFAELQILKDEVLGQGPQHISYTVALFSAYGRSTGETRTPNNMSSAHVLVSALFKQISPILFLQHTCRDVPTHGYVPVSMCTESNGCPLTHLRVSACLQVAVHTDMH